MDGKDLNKTFSGGVDQVNLDGKGIAAGGIEGKSIDSITINDSLAGIVKRIFKFDGIKAAQSLGQAGINGGTLFPSLQKSNEFRKINSLAIGAGAINFRKRSKKK